MGQRQPFQRVPTVAAIAAWAVIAGFGSAAGIALPAQAQPLLEETGTIVPAEHSYEFAGTAGQAVTITLESEAFDSVVELQDPDGNQIAVNDDFGGTLNSTIIMTLPADGSYTVVARSFSGEGGDYQLSVRPSTPYEIAYMEAQSLVQAGDFVAAIAAYDQAVSLDADQPSAYLGRAEAYLGKVYAELGEQVSGPQDIPPTERAAVIADFEKAADLIEASGNQDWANSLREQANFLRSSGEPGAAPDEAPAEPAPDAPVAP